MVGERMYLFRYIDKVSGEIKLEEEWPFLNSKEAAIFLTIAQMSEPECQIKVYEEMFFD